ncbi:DNA ligase 1 [Grifola frondosa]|uniref:DNA ligase n=1 Tax=Grifola frondosa TaxID=5627 RepID=A0A1C7MVU2_GRIFR|nr:DNA ligase 1 [Grifola frondosa]
MLVTVTVRVRVALPRPTTVIRRGLSNRMGRQQTLGKFFEMPKGAKPPPAQQSKLEEMWGGKRKREAIQSERKSEPSAEKFDVKAEAKRKASPEVTDSQPISDSKAPTTSHISLSESDKPPKVKKRRIVDSDDEVLDVAMDTEPGPSKPGPKASTSYAFSSSSPKLPPSPKPKAKRAPKVLEEDNAIEKDEQSTSSAGEDEGGEEEDHEEDLEEEEEGVASKNAEAALSGQMKWISRAGERRRPVFALIEATTKRIEKTSLLTGFPLASHSSQCEGDTNSLLQACIYALIGSAQITSGSKLGIGESLLVKAIGESTGRSLAVVKADLKKEGDLGLVAMNSKNSQKTLFKPKPLTVPFVFTNLKEIALSSGHSSQNKKVSIITKLLAACQGSEAKYIVRSLEGKLRIGNAERTVLVALAHASVLAEQEAANKRLNKEKLAARLEQAASILKSVYSELPTYDLVIPALLEVGVDKLPERCKLTPGVPLKPMLAKPTKAIGEVLDKFEDKRFTCEYKYDGERAQVHKLEDGTIAVFSRNSEDMSKKYPDLMEQLPKCVKEDTKTFVFDAEAVAIDKDTGKLMPFQELSRRKRKDVKVEDIQVRVCLFAFDLLYLNGEPLLHKDFVERRQMLHEHFQPVPGEFSFATASDCETIDEIQAFLEESVKDGCEGLMVKMLEGEHSFYEPSRRTVNWLKLKKDYLAGIGDSLDLVVVGGYYGKGKRTNVYGAFLLACYDADAEEYQTICKIGTGFSEEALQAHYEALKPLEMTKVRGDVKVGGAKPDVWFEPKIVWEVLTADLSLSPIYTAAQGLADDRGISLRFPRFIRIRDDKAANDATGPEQIAEMYERQVLAQSKGGKKKKGGEGEDGFW